jgi:hypothetical protein
MVASLGQANSTPLLLPTVQGEMLPFGDRSNLPNLRSQLLISVKGQNRAFFWRRNCQSCSALPSMPGSFEPNPLYDHFKAILRQELFGSWSGVIFRSVSPRYARPADIGQRLGILPAAGRPAGMRGNSILLPTFENSGYQARVAPAVNDGDHA